MIAARPTPIKDIYGATSKRLGSNAHVRVLLVGMGPDLPRQVPGIALMPGM